MAINIPLFIKRLKSTIAWTARLSEGFDHTNGNYGTVFRQTNPVISDIPTFTIKDGFTTWNIDDLNINNYINLLTISLAGRNISIDITDFHSLGRILMFNMMNTTQDGAPIQESKYFFDERDVPPIDTWFYIYDHTLYCWIPKEFEHVVENGIAVEILDSYDWLDLHPAIYNDIRTKFGQPQPLYTRTRPLTPVEEFEAVYKDKPANLRDALIRIKGLGMNKMQAISIVLSGTRGTLREAQEMVVKSGLWEG